MPESFVMFSTEEAALQVPGWHTGSAIRFSFRTLRRDASLLYQGTKHPVMDTSRQPQYADDGGSSSRRTKPGKIAGKEEVQLMIAMVDGKSSVRLYMCVRVLE